MAYLTTAQYRDRTVLPASYVDDVEANAPDWVQRALERKSRWIDARLRKRYAVPFASPVPETVLDWLARIVTLELLLKHGVDPTDLQFQAYRESAERAEAEVAEAANSETGLFDLPLLANVSASGIVHGGPFGYSEQSPYVGFDLQAEIGREEDRSRRGTYG